MLILQLESAWAGVLEYALLLLLNWLLLLIDRVSSRCRYSTTIVLTLIIGAKLLASAISCIIVVELSKVTIAHISLSIFSLN